jgi:hypothetical protein
VSRRARITRSLAQWPSAARVPRVGAHSPTHAQRRDRYAARDATLHRMKTKTRIRAGAMLGNPKIGDVKYTFNMSQTG